MGAPNSTLKSPVEQISQSKGQTPGEEPPNDQVQQMKPESKEVSNDYFEALIS